MARGEKKKIVVKKRFPTQLSNTNFKNRTMIQGLTHGSITDSLIDEGDKGILLENIKTTDDIKPLVDYIMDLNQITNPSEIDTTIYNWYYENFMNSDISDGNIRKTRLLTSEFKLYPIRNYTFCIETDNPIYNIMDPEGLEGAWTNAGFAGITFNVYNMFTNSWDLTNIYVNDLEKITIDVEPIELSSIFNSFEWYNFNNKTKINPIIKFGISDVMIDGYYNSKNKDNIPIDKYNTCMDLGILGNKLDGIPIEGENYLYLSPIKGSPNNFAELKKFFTTSVYNNINQNKDKHGILNYKSDKICLFSNLFFMATNFVKYKIVFNQNIHISNTPFVYLSAGNDDNLDLINRNIKYYISEYQHEYENEDDYFTPSVVTANMIVPVTRFDRGSNLFVTNEDKVSGFKLYIPDFVTNESIEYKLSYTYLTPSGKNYSKKINHPHPVKLLKGTIIELEPPIPLDPSNVPEFYNNINTDNITESIVINFDENISYDLVEIIMEVSRDIKTRESTGDPSSGTMDTGGLALLSVGVGNEGYFAKGGEPFFTESLNEYMISYDSDGYYQQQEKTVNGEYFWASNTFFMKLEQGHKYFNMLGSPSRLFLEVDVDFRGSRKISFNTEIAIDSSGKIKEELIFGGDVTEEDLKFIEEGIKPRIRVKWTVIPK